MGILGKEVVNLDITSYQGVTADATHWYVHLQGDLNDDLEHIQLSAPLTPAHAAELNKDDGWNTIMWKTGDMYTGFKKYHRDVQAGIDQWKKTFPEAKFLLLGRAVNVEPKPVLDTVFENDDKLKQKTAAIVEKGKAIGWYNDPKNDDLMDEYYNEWLTLLRTWLREK